eukprot:3355245-Karenia_brevis.AAC.1
MDMQISKLSKEASLTGEPPFRMKVNVRVNIDGVIKRLNELTDKEYEQVSTLFCNGAKAAHNRVIIIDCIGNVPAD